MVKVKYYDILNMDYDCNTLHKYSYIFVTKYKNVV